ncbi:DUF29 domain-containing protein [Candidatus Venteria ishoeyi]|uniref:DUF29 domain-containing protein n=1 Tax=Candidatus Venteria ishoeyi TaxID=1899563 RepID=A0A1H6FC29_9GAMM|nr:DUF29 domain-containing protein [Candidatus Venteria ishoeyi]MDM8546306.1 DUF29 domain-containing protein [Candidatus Venteria ishoeyi]SEH06594.1 Uncharacterised protein [Candidatus Venteria ishoeyi]
MNNSQLNYENDFYNWTRQQIELLKTGRFNKLDTVHLIEELEDMGKSQLRELESRLIVLIAHLLKWQFQLSSLTEQWQEFEGKSWRKTIIEQRTQLLGLFEDMPSLKNKMPGAIIKVYPKAVLFAVDETSLPKNTFPDRCPYSTEQLMDKKFYPVNA